MFENGLTLVFSFLFYFVLFFFFTKNIFFPQVEKDLFEY